MTSAVAYDAVDVLRCEVEIGGSVDAGTHVRNVGYRARVRLADVRVCERDAARERNKRLASIFVTA
jgi:hypothetical protein